MDYRVEKEVQDDGCRLLSMFDGDSERVCHFAPNKNLYRLRFRLPMIA